MSMTRMEPVPESATAKARGGRPSKPGVEALNQRLLAAAAELFLQDGFGGVSMDAIALRARVSKRTLYSRFRDKAALFEAVLYDLLGRLAPIETPPLEEPAELDAALHQVAQSMIATTLKQEFLPVHRLITFEAQRRPEFGQWIDRALRRPRVRVIAAILQRFRTELRVSDFEIAAEQFWDLTLDSCLRAATFGRKLSPRQIDERVAAAADVFLSGVRRRDSQASCWLCAPGAESGRRTQSAKPSPRRQP